MVMSPVGLGAESDCAGESQQQLQTTAPSSRQKVCNFNRVGHTTAQDGPLWGSPVVMSGLVIVTEDSVSIVTAFGVWPIQTC
jgi:hypothetical protein